MRSKLALAAFVAAFTGALCLGAGEPAKRASVQEANELLLAGENQRAVEVYEAAGPQASPKKEAWRLNNWGLALIRMEKAGQAAVVLEKAVQADPKNFTAWANLGASYENIGDKVKAADTYRRALDLVGKETRALAAGGRKPDLDTLQNAATDTAPDEFKEPASRLKDADMRAALKKAADLLAEEKFAEAADAYATIGMCSGAKREGWKLNNWGLALIRIGKYEDALPRLKKSVEVYPENPKAWNNLGVAFENLAMEAEARQAYAKAAGWAPGAEVDAAKLELNRVKLDFNVEKKRWESIR